jgi:DNA gyrase subunit A
LENEQTRGFLLTRIDYIRKIENKNIGKEYDMEIGMVKKIDIDHEMQQAYLDYAMSVIVSRALPDARDGMKPVQRRLLYAMYDMGLRPETSYKKSARIVGEVLGKYHPHGDQAVYEAMARLAQDFSMRYPLVDGQGNFGSIDGDPPAAMRYTEARITHFALDILNQLDRETIDFVKNFDETLNEPAVLPAAIPNLLVNGASGIAVGMATSIPPHNLAEVIDAILYLLKHWDKYEDVTVSDLMNFVQGPDFPTGGLILQGFEQNDLLSAYATGKGRITVRGRVNIEEMTRGKSRIIITELPYMTNKASLIERIADLVRDGTIEGIADLRDESDRHGMRIVIEVSKGAEAEKVLRELYKKTPIESTFSINLLALVDGQPRLLTLKQALKVYIEHRIEVVTRRSKYDLRKAKERLHILEGYRIAIKNLDDVIETIRSSQDSEQAKQRLMKKFKLSDIQAQAILDLQLRRLAALERKKIEMEYKEVADRVKELEELLSSPIKIRNEVALELSEIRSRYQDRRLTQIVSLKEGKGAHELLTVQDVVPAEKTWVGITEEGMIFRTNSDAMPRQSGTNAPFQLLHVDTHQILYIVAGNGKCATLAVHVIPGVEKPEEGVKFNKICSLEEEDTPVRIFTIPANGSAEDQVILTLSRQGLIKKSAIGDLPGASAHPFILAKVNDGDEIADVLLAKDNSDYMVATSGCMAIRFSGSEVRTMGLVSAGVNAIKLPADNKAVGLLDLENVNELLFVGSDGSGWRQTKEDYPVQGRYGQGVVVGKAKPGIKLIGLISGKKNTTYSLFFQKSTAKTFRMDVIPAAKRGLAAKALIEIKSGDQVKAICKPSEDFASAEDKEGKTEKSTKAPAIHQKELIPIKDKKKASVKKSAAEKTELDEKKKSTKVSAGKNSKAKKSSEKGSSKKTTSEKKTGKKGNASNRIQSAEKTASTKKSKPEADSDSDDYKQESIL